MEHDPTVPTLPTLPTVPSDRGGDPWPAPNTLAPPHAPPLEPAPVVSPKRSRSRLFGLVAAVALVVLGIGAIAAIRSGAGSTSTVEVDDSSAFSLAAAAEQAAAANTVRYRMDMSMGALGQVSISGGVDNDAQVMTMTMDASALLGGGDVEQIETIIDVGNGVMYMSTAGMGLPAAWVSIDLTVVAEQSGMSLDEYRAQLAADPLDIATALTAADAVVDLGDDSIDDIPVRHYRVTIDVAEAIAATPQLEQQLDLTGLDTELPSTIDYDVWVTEQSQLRRLAFTIGVAGQSLSVELNVTDIGAPLDIESPPADQVMDMTGFLGD